MNKITNERKQKYDKSIKKRPNSVEKRGAGHSCLFNVTGQYKGF